MRRPSINRSGDALSPSDRSNGLGPDSRTVAHKLLTELLAHQFAFPVKWIDTQDELFSKKNAISRFVEVGPGKVLGGMARRTVDVKFATRDISRSVERRFFSSSIDGKDIYYEYDPVVPAEMRSEINTEDSLAGIPEALNAPQTPSTKLASTESSAALPQAIAAASISDVSIPASQIVQALIAHKLKKKFEDVLVSKSIKEISGGKSTLQNELIGDLGNEFGNLPDAAEELSIALLGEALETSFNGQLGKHSSSIVARLISSKMPVGFNHISIREYLKHTWGLGHSRQASVLLFAITSEPASRSPSIDAAKDYFDAVVSRYAAANELTLSRGSASNNNSQDTVSIVSSAQLDAIRQEQRHIVSKQHKLLADYLQINPSSDVKVTELETYLQESQEKLDAWCSEFPADFESGIKPRFDRQKLRRYNASWNTVRQDILSIYHRAQYSHLSGQDFTASTILHIANRADRIVHTLVDSLTTRSEECGHVDDGFAPIGRELSTAIAATVNQPPVFLFMAPMTAPQTVIDNEGRIRYKEVSREFRGSSAIYVEFVRQQVWHQEIGSRIPYVHIRRQQGSTWKFDSLMTDKLFESLSIGVKSGISFVGKHVLITGAGRNSIGAEILRGLLMGGAKVIATTSRGPSGSATFYQKLYEECGSRESELLILPFNQGSARDCQALVDYIYSDSGLGRNLDAVIPFAAISESGTELDELDSKSELAHRLMMVNVLRLLGHIVRNKSERVLNTRPTQVILPLSPNHGTFGGDGFYGESKLGLEALLNRFKSETWADYLTVCGAVIGWTRGTGLMSDNDIVAQTIESRGVLTFSQKEMAFNLLVLMATPISEVCEVEPLWADFSGGLHHIPDLNKLLIRARSDINSKSQIRRAIAIENAIDDDLSSHLTQLSVLKSDSSQVPLRSTLRIGFPSLPDFDKRILPLQDLQGMVDHNSTIVIVGFSELGPWGSSRTRWEMENSATFTQEGYIEMAWMMNLIKHFDGEEKGEHYVGWVDAKTGEHVPDSNIMERYGSQILEHSGIRLIEPTLFGGYDPERKEYLHEVAIEEDLPEFDATQATAEAFKLQHGDKVNIRRRGEADEYKVLIKRGAHIMVPKAVPFDSIVAGQIPTGWNPVKYGVSEDLILQVDPVTLYTLCCASEALYSAGITDSLEIFQHIHTSELGNFIGSAMGGMTKTRQMYKDRYLDKPVQGDVIQETYLNTSAAWMNMLLLGSSGPIKTPTGTCATGVESLDSGCESILAGKTKLCFVGGVDDFQEDESYGFATMKATVNTKDEFAKGRIPAEMSRPTSESRSGFVESQGCGMQIITTAKLALEMGLPIYGIVASSTMAADKISQSVPAPGQGVLSFARETANGASSPLLDLAYRRGMMQASISRELYGTPGLEAMVSESGIMTPSSSESESIPRSELHTASLIASLSSSSINRLTALQKLWSNDFRRQDTEISPMRASLAVWGLTIDDLDFVSMHGTSTKANDKNEAEVINKQLTHLGRTPGLPILAICQKSLTGHPKGPAAAWMLNGALQAMQNSEIPGNRNADNVDEVLRKFEHLVFPTKSIATGELKAFLLNSFGFGQKGGQVICVAPRYLFATLKKDEFEDYAAKFTTRTKVANREYIKSMVTNSIFKAKTSPAYVSQDESRILMDPQARVSQDKQQALRFDVANSHPQLPVTKLQSYQNSEASTHNITAAAQAFLEANTRVCSDPVTVGIDVDQVLDTFLPSNTSFIERNFTLTEREYAEKSPNPQATFAGRWCAKEAVFKSLGVPSKGAGASMKDIEVLSAGGVPKVKLHGDAYLAAKEKGVKYFKVSLSHSETTVMAVALAFKNNEDIRY